MRIELRASRTWITVLAVTLAPTATCASAESAIWSGYLDAAHVYASAEPDVLRERLAEYGSEAGISLERYIADHFTALPPLRDKHDAAETRRKAIALLLDYLARDDASSLATSAESARMLESRLTSFENRYWYHYVLAHEAMESGDGFDFAEQILAAWVRVVVPLEGSFETLDTIALSEGPYSGFVPALPYLHENLARLILIRSQRRGLDSGLDALGAIIELLARDRVGAHPEIIPLELSSQGYVEHVAGLLQGPNSDNGSLTFVLTLLRADRWHDRWRSLLASDGLSEATLRAGRAATGAYQTALKRAETVGGKCAVYTRALRLSTELYAAKQRTGSDAEIADPFAIEAAIQIYERLTAGLTDGWYGLGYG